MRPVMPSGASIDGTVALCYTKRTSSVRAVECTTKYGTIYYFRISNQRPGALTIHLSERPRLLRSLCRPVSKFEKKSPPFLVHIPDTD